MLKILGVSRTGYHAFKNTKPSAVQRQKDIIKTEIQAVYDTSKQSYCAPESTKELLEEGETISERTVGKYMKEMGIRVQWLRPWTIAIKDADFSSKLQNVLNEQFDPRMS